MVKAWARGCGLESWCCWLPVPSWKVKIPAYEEMSSGKLSQVTVQVFSNWFHQQHWACSRHTVAFKNLKTVSAMVQSELNTVSMPVSAVVQSQLNTVSMPVPADVLTGNEIWKIVIVKGWLLDMLAHCRFICSIRICFIWTHISDSVIASNSIWCVLLPYDYFLCNPVHKEWRLISRVEAFKVLSTLIYEKLNGGGGGGGQKQS